MTEEELKEQEKEMVQEAEIVSDYVPFGVVSFEELDGVKQSQAAGQMARALSRQFQEMVGNIFTREDVEDKAGAIKSLADEFAQRVDDAMEQKEITDKRWQPLTDKVMNLVADYTKATMKTVGGRKYPAGDFLVVEDSEKPTTWHLQVRRNGKPDHNLMGAAWAALHKGHRGNKYQGPDKQKATSKLKSLYKSEKMSLPSTKEEFSVWKEADGTTRWFAVYSNNYRDDDKPPEIISKAAHLDFVDAVDKKEWPMPELWHWHVKGSRYGVATTIAYDEDTGMSVAAGTIDKGMEEIAKSIFERNPLVSHGMPTPEIRRDETDPTVLTRYRTKEISTLPDEAAANKITFYDLKEQDMNIPEQKLEELRAVGFDVAALTAKLEEGKGQAENEKRESKETKEEVVESVAETDAPQETAKVPETEVPETTPDVVPALTAEDIATAFTAAIEPLTSRLDALEGQIKEISKPEEQEEKELDLTPAMSVTEMMKSAVIGKEETQVDGRKARHDGPTETKGQNPGAALNSGQALMDDIVNTITSPDRSWLSELPGVQVEQ